MIKLGKMKTGISRSRQPDAEWGDTFVRGWQNFRGWVDRPVLPFLDNLQALRMQLGEMGESTLITSIRNRAAIPENIWLDSDQNHKTATEINILQEGFHRRRISQQAEHFNLRKWQEFCDQILKST